MRPVRLSARVSITSCACVAGSDKSGQACAAHTHARARAHTHTQTAASTQAQSKMSCEAHTPTPSHLIFKLRALRDVSSPAHRLLLFLCLSALAIARAPFCTTQWHVPG